MCTKKICTFFVPSDLDIDLFIFALHHHSLA